MFVLISETARSILMGISWIVKWWYMEVCPSVQSAVDVVPQVTYIYYLIYIIQYFITVYAVMIMMKFHRFSANIDVDA